jgi:hypothetical protein
MNFSKFLRDSFSYFAKKLVLSRETGVLWEKECGQYPDEFFDWALQQLKALNSGRDFLANPPKVIHELWQQWLKLNPRKVERRELQCLNPHCEDERFYVYEREKDTDILTRRTAFCGECKAMGQQMTNGMTRAQAESSGYILPCAEWDAAYEAQQKTLHADAWDRNAELRRPKILREKR